MKICRVLPLLPFASSAAARPSEPTFSTSVTPTESSIPWTNGYVNLKVPHLNETIDSVVLPACAGSTCSINAGCQSATNGKTKRQMWQDYWDYLGDDFIYQWRLEPNETAPPPAAHGAIQCENALSNPFVRSITDPSKPVGRELSPGLHCSCTNVLC